VCPADGEPLPPLGEDVAGAVVYGGRFDVERQDEFPFLTDEIAFIEAALRRNLPVLGICLGAQLMAHCLGQKVHGHPQGSAEYGYYPLVPTVAGRALFGDGLWVLESHWHGWYDTPAGATLLASSALFSQQAFRYGENAYALQFHPEASFKTLTKWIARRGERNYLPGAFPPERQIADHARHDGALGVWFEAFLARWAKPAARAALAAE
jgi:GMP synthase (glutamine-hydrolysing)